MAQDKRKKRVFLIEIKILSNEWNYKKDDVLTIPLLSNSHVNAIETFTNYHCGSEYPQYSINSIIDTFEYGFFKPNNNLKLN